MQYKPELHNKYAQYTCICTDMPTRTSGLESGRTNLHLTDLFCGKMRRNCNFQLECIHTSVFWLLDCGLPDIQVTLYIWT